jgi:hypothetical integral membrane protein (TIGR02206 family)
MPDFFARDYTGGSFVLFGRDHLIGLAMIVLVCLTVWLFRDRWNDRTRKITRWSLLGLIYLCEGSWQVWMLATDSWTIQQMLPLWVCSITAWTMPLLLIWRSYRYYEWAYLIGIMGAVMALLTPDLMNYGFPHFRFIEFFTLHGAIIVAVIYMTAVEGFRPTWKSLPRVLVMINVYWLFCAWVNNQIGSNYLYTQGKLPTPSLLDVLGPHPWYLLAMEGIGIVLAILMILPFAGRGAGNQG